MPIAVLLVLAGCGIWGGGEYPLQEWEVPAPPRGPKSCLEDSEIDQEIVAKLKKLHEAQPVVEGYTKISLQSVCKEETTGHTFYYFGISGIAEYLPVFRIDSGGNIIDNFIFSIITR